MLVGQDLSFPNTWQYGMLMSPTHQKTEDPACRMQGYWAARGAQGGNGRREQRQGTEDHDREP
jgi:hypothetical protein